MKKVVLALAVAMLGLAALDANAYGRRGRCCRPACEAYEPVCETKCCETRCEKPCHKPCAQYKKIVHEAPCQQPPICRRYVPVCEPATCIEERKCHWVCPESCEEVVGQVQEGDYSFIEVKD